MLKVFFDGLSELAEFEKSKELLSMDKMMSILLKLENAMETEQLFEDSDLN